MLLRRPLYFDVAGREYAAVGEAAQGVFPAVYVAGERLLRHPLYVSASVREAAEASLPAVYVAGRVTAEVSLPAAYTAFDRLDC